jgi:ADP-heptose:LPS heptosyltransferase
MHQQADAARDNKEYMKAAFFYEEVLSQAPDDAAIHVQCGHMFKEAGELYRAEQHYNKARVLMPNDPDLALQLGHFYKVAGRLEEAELSYRRAAELMPGAAEPVEELAGLARRRQSHSSDNRLQRFKDALNDFSINRLLSSELAPRPYNSHLHPHSEKIEIWQLGRRQRTDWGIHTTLRGVEAIRGFCVSAHPITDLCVSLNGRTIHREGPLNGYSLKYESHDRNKRKYVFNVWYDFSQFVNGLYDIELQFIHLNGSLRTYRDRVVIDEPLQTEEYPNSDRLVVVSPNDDRPIEEQINTQPSMVREARRAVFSTPPQNVLVIRADQLGDMVMSIPAIRRLRELLPNAYIVGLVSVANIEPAESLHLFDEMIAIQFSEDEWERRRVLPLDKQYELWHRLNKFKFDVAIDLSAAGDSRHLLVLSGAPYVIGFRDDRSPWLSASIDLTAHDPVNRLCELSHSGMMLTLVEFFGVLLGNRAQITRRDDLTRDRLAAYGLTAGDEFTVLHTGARLKFSRWPHYDALASMIIEKTDLKVVMMTDDPAKRAELPSRLLSSDRFQLLDRQLPFDDFDALLSFCTVFVGNDSGPSHLASLRGANVVNLYMARHNWNEWGHENQGYIITRRVPCAGCNIHFEPEECGKDFACIANISPDEVYRAVMRFV